MRFGPKFVGEESWWLLEPTGGWDTAASVGAAQGPGFRREGRAEWQEVHKPVAVRWHVGNRRRHKLCHADRQSRLESKELEVLFVLAAQGITCAARGEGRWELRAPGRCSAASAPCAAGTSASCSPRALSGPQPEPSSAHVGVLPVNFQFNWEPEVGVSVEPPLDKLAVINLLCYKP